MKIEWVNHSMVRSASQGPETEGGRLIIDTESDPRKLAFRFAPVESPATLETNQIEQFNRNGYLSPLDVFDNEEITEIGHYVDDLVAKVVDAPDQRNAYSIINYHVVCRGLYDIVHEPRILDYVQDLLGSDLVAWNTHLFYKSPRDPMEVPFHQDVIYWPLTHSASVTVWLAIDDVDEGNAAVKFVPGSHLAGPLPHEQKPLDGTRTLKREAMLPASVTPYVNSMRAGQVSIHSDLLLHGSAANTSGRRRAALAIRYAAADLRALPGAEWYLHASTPCRGEIPAHWPRRRRPKSEHPELMANLWGDFDGTTYDPS
ncbi:MULTISPECIES: phytanoyl-CoA dioxygenase family protein [unclassified Micromonospora]|uniref:phytanoyl-CoA dioxygenase family protein n=1 Tax=unclassified Micromonospora TaxID=2617518 RepID=UPI002FF141B1